MIEEEKEAIENLKKLVELRKDKTNTIKHDTCICGTKELDIALNLIQNQQSEKEQLKAEIEKKDKIIDLMADMLSALMTDITVVKKQFEEGYCEFVNSNEECCWKTDIKCSDCIKQYVEKQVEKE